MFTFEDFVHLNPKDVQKILRDVDMADLALALKGASETLRTFVLSCMSKRAAESISEEIEFLDTAKQKDIEAAQLKISATARRLESEEEIDLSDAQGGGS
jgi:flagellar motor switch protein FliG